MFLWLLFWAGVVLTVLLVWRLLRAPDGPPAVGFDARFGPETDITKPEKKKE
jgi:hypothetical protein